MPDLEIELYDDGDGRLVTSDGEIIDLPSGTDRQAYAARRYKDAKDQIKQWQRDAAIYQAVILRECPEPMTWDTFTTRVQRGSHPVQDIPTIAEDIIAVAYELFDDSMIHEESGTRKEQLMDLLKTAVARWDAKEAPMWAADIIIENTTQAPNRPFVAIGGIKKLAPAREKAGAS